ncbi:NAD(P)-binding domain-containing protein, partial [uncultured Enorma sp.]
MDVTTVNIGFLGFGNMASAIADGWLATGAVPA